MVRCVRSGSVRSTSEVFTRLLPGADPGGSPEFTGDSERGRFSKPTVGTGLSGRRRSVHAHTPRLAIHPDRRWYAPRSTSNPHPRARAQLASRGVRDQTRKGCDSCPVPLPDLGRAREGVSSFWRAASTQPRSELIRVEFDAPPRSRPMFGRPLEEARVLVERHGPAAAPADEPRLVGVVLGDGVPVLRQDERMFA